MSQQNTSSDWLVDNKAKSARHSSGLVIQLSSNSNAPNRPASLEILQLEKLVGTAWASRSNLLIEAGISLLKTL